MQPTEAVSSAWKQLRPLFVRRVAEKERAAWEQYYVPGMPEVDEYVAGSFDRFAMLCGVLGKNLPAGARILDAGAGHGLLALSLKQMGFAAEASDIIEGFPLLAEAGLPYRPWHLECDPAPFDARSFDAVVLSQTLEHFTYSPRHALDESLRIIKPGGLLLIDVPNIACFHNISRLVRGKSLHWEFAKHYLQQDPVVHRGIPYYDRHNHEYSREDLLDIARFYDLEKLAVRYYSSYNHDKRGALAIFFSRLRDALPHVRKAIYALYRKRTDTVR